MVNDNARCEWCTNDAAEKVEDHDGYDFVLLCESCASAPYPCDSCDTAPAYRELSAHYRAAHEGF